MSLYPCLRHHLASLLLSKKWQCQDSWNAQAVRHSLGEFKFKAVSTFRNRLKQLMQLLKFYSVEGKPIERTECKGYWCKLIPQRCVCCIYCITFWILLMGLVYKPTVYTQGRQACTHKCYTTEEKRSKNAIESVKRKINRPILWSECMSN